MRAARLVGGTDGEEELRQQPHLDLIEFRSQNEAYCIANPGVEYGVFFPEGGNVRLIIDADTPVSVRWMDIRKAAWHSEASEVQPEGGKLTLETPTLEGYWAALVQYS